MLQAGPAKKKSLDTEGGDGGPQVRLGSVDPAAIQTFPLLHRSTLNTHLESHYPRCYVIYILDCSVRLIIVKMLPRSLCPLSCGLCDVTLNSPSSGPPGLGLESKIKVGTADYNYPEQIVLGTLYYAMIQTHKDRQTVFLYCVNELLQSKTKSIPSSFLSPSSHILTV